MRREFRKQGDIVASELEWGYLRWVSNPKETEAENLTVIHADIFPGQGHDFHRHPGQEEVIFVIEGTIEQWIEAKSQLLGPGDSVVIPADVVHASFNVGNETARILAILGPCVGEAGIAQVDVSGEAPWSKLRTKTEAAE